jgi:hypothetical protein
MHIRSGKFASLLLAAAFISPVLITGCEAHARVYDSYDHGYRQWAPESPYYSQWEAENHYRHERFERRSRRQQQEYWQWRHEHQDQQRNRDDRHHHHDRDDQHYDNH